MKLQDKLNRYFHVTPCSNLESILQNGLIPQIGERSQIAQEPDHFVFLFPSFEDMDNALYNWLGEAFDDLNEDLIILQIDLPDQFPLYKDSDDIYEVYTDQIIPQQYITNIYNEYYQSIKEQMSNDMERN